MKIKLYIKRHLKKYPRLLNTLSNLYYIASPALWNVRVKDQIFKDQMYADYLMSPIVTKRYGSIEARYKASSPKNYWQMAIGSQHEDLFMGDVFALLGKDDIVLDVGANSGLYTVPFAIVASKVYAFEPDPVPREALKENILLNNITNVVILPVAVSNNSRLIKFYLRPEKDTGSIFEKTPDPSPTGIQETIWVKADTIDNTVKKENIKAPKLVKIDVEGAELIVLEGMSKTRPKYLLIEVHDMIDNLKVEARLREMDYVFTYLDDIHILASLHTGEI